jgi:hypothetical protein
MAYDSTYVGFLYIHTHTRINTHTHTHTYVKTKPLCLLSKHCVTELQPHPNEVSRVDKLIEVNGVGRMECYCLIDTVSVWDHEKVLKIDATKLHTQI